jgi:putative RNA 2'-phosphotransferase
MGRCEREELTVAQHTRLAATSKFLSYVLRHHPESIGLILDPEGWANVDTLVARANATGRLLDRELLATVVATNEKQRFAFSDDRRLIRAVQGHSIQSVAIRHIEKLPPEFLYHGTAVRFLNSIREAGLHSGARHHVHLSTDKPSAMRVGQRHGKPVVLTIAAGEMSEAGFKFFQADNGVWLATHIPPQFITE